MHVLHKAMQPTGFSLSPNPLIILNREQNHKDVGKSILVVSAAREVFCWAAFVAESFMNNVQHLCKISARSIEN